VLIYCMHLYVDIIILRGIGLSVVVCLNLNLEASVWSFDYMHDIYGDPSGVIFE
jgi:hypothetical protein